MSITSIRIADDVEKPLEALSKKLDRSKNYIMNQAIKELRNLLRDNPWKIQGGKIPLRHSNP